MENYQNEERGSYQVDMTRQVMADGAANIKTGVVSGDQMNSDGRFDTQGITSIDSLRAYARGRVVRLPDFAEGMPFVARMRRPSILSLVKFGKIPNDLLRTAGSLFLSDGNALDSDDPSMLSNVSDLLSEIAKASLIEPTYEDVLNAGLELTDEQLMAIFNYSQGGIEALKPFRE